MRRFINDAKGRVALVALGILIGAVAVGFNGNAAPVTSLHSGVVCSFQSTKTSVFSKKVQLPHKTTGCYKPPVRPLAHAASAGCLLKQTFSDINGLQSGARKFIRLRKPVRVNKNLSAATPRLRIGGYRLTKRVVLCYGEYSITRVSNGVPQWPGKPHRFKVGPSRGSVTISVPGGVTFSIYARYA